MAQQPESFPGVYPGTIKGHLDPPALSAKADLVVRGEVETVRDEGRITYLVHGKPLDFTRRVAAVRVDRVDKGRAGRRIEVEFLAGDLPSSLESISPGERAVFYLTRKNDRYGFADVTTSKGPY